MRRRLSGCWSCKKSRAFFDGIAGRYESLTEPGGGWQALAAGLAAGFAGNDVADLGCGEGALTLLLARFAKRVVAYDQSEKMLQLVSEKATKQNVRDQVELRQGNLENLNLSGEAFDAVFLSQSLHHTSQPEDVLCSAAAGLRKGGRLVILDLVRHEHEWTREEWADQWLGFDPLEIREWLERAGIDPQIIDSLPGATPDLSVLIVVGTKTV